MKKLPALKHPQYTTTLPVSKQKVTYRPFTVQEEKNILIAVESDDTSSIVTSAWELVNSCSGGKLNKEALAGADFEFLLLQIRSKSVGEVVEGSLKCDACGEKGSYDINIPDLQVIGEWRTKDITVQPGYVVTLGMPTVNTALETLDMEAGREERALATCIKMVTVDNEVYKHEDLDLADLVGLILDLPSNIYNKMMEFIQTGPRLSYDSAYTCKKCGHVQAVHLEGFDSFFG
jgi:hypothetical protein